MKPPDRPEPDEELPEPLPDAVDETLAAGQREELAGVLACLLRREAVRRREEAAPSRQFGRFRIVRELGRGGSGVVFLAHDTVLGREVALKLPRPEVLLSPPLRQRFLREARAAAGLDHPHLVGVYEAGAVGDICYIASAYCPGPTLKDWLRQWSAAVPTRACAAFVAMLADATHFFHERGILHRDLKPANILLRKSENRNPKSEKKPEECGSDFGFRFSDFEPKVTDFGLAKFFQETAGAEAPTRTGAVLGTAQYMAPEQAEGRSRQIGPGTDVWALGVILYELLTGQVPFPGATDIEVGRRISAAEPAAPQTLRPEVESGLQTICLKCLHKEPSGRYQTARDLADDLRCFLANEPIAARPPSPWGRYWKSGRRSALAAFLFLLIVCLPLLILSAAWLPRAAGPQSEEERQEAEYQAALAPLKREVDEGRPVTVVASKRLAYRWRAGHGRISFPQSRDGTRLMRVAATEPSLLELFPAPGIAAYRIEVTMRQDESYSHFGDAGLCAGHSSQLVDNRPQHFFVRASFADLGDAAWSFRDARGRKGSMVQLCLCYVGTSAESPFRISHAYSSVLFYVPAQAATARGPGPWRTLTVDVRPNAFDVHWDGRTARLVPGKVLSRWWRGLRRDFPELRGVNREPPLRGPLGLYLYGCSVSIKRLTVTPLPDGLSN